MKHLLEQAGYVCEPQMGIWVRPGFTSIAYSDGDEVEQRLARIVGAATDLSVLSDDLKNHITDWPSLYHLSNNRANILRPFERFFAGAQVLEIGAGCGAISRYMGESGAQVLALEGAIRRADIARKRTRDLPNVEVLAERFDQFNTNAQFDIVTLIGVLEYANMFVPGAQPALTMLQRARALLKPGGLLLIAIENQLGVKYWAGAPEDHLGVPMYGIEGRYRTDQPQTYGRKKLQELITAAGFAHADFLSALPDYKLPISIVTSGGFESDDFDAAALASQSVRRDPQLPQQLSFAPELAWPAVVENGIGMDLANSFLIAASVSEASALDPDVLAFHYSTGRRREYCKQTIFQRSPEGDIGVHCKLIAPANAAPGGLLHFQAPPYTKYIQGQTLASELVQLVSRDGWSLDAVGEFLRSYLQVVRSIVCGERPQPTVLTVHELLPGESFDLLPQNIIRDVNGYCHAIDREWVLRGEMPVGWLLCRGLQLLVRDVTRFGAPASNFETTCSGFIQAAFRSTGYEIDYPTLEAFAAMEAQAQAEAAGLTLQQIPKLLSDSPLPMRATAQMVAAHTQRIEQLESQLSSRDQQLLVLTQTLSSKDQQLSSLTQTLASQDHQIASLTQSILASQDRLITGMTQDLADSHDQRLARLSESLALHQQQLSHLAQTLAAKDAQIAALYSSASWRIMAPVRWAAQPLINVGTTARAIGSVLQRNGGLLPTARLALRVLQQQGLPALLYAARTAVKPQKIQHAGLVALPLHTDSMSGSSPAQQAVVPDRNDYTEWVRRYDTLTDADRQRMRDVQAAFAVQPLISVVMPTYNAKAEWLIEAIDSVRRQIYPRWQLCIADDASTDPAIRPILERYAMQDERIKVVFRQKNGHISAASNSAIELATGEWIALLDHDDLLNENALFWVAETINRAPDARLIYSDEDKISESGRRSDPYFKCDWNPDLFYSHNMICHLGVYNACIVKEIGGFRQGFEGSQDYDIALRCIERIDTAQIIHIPRVLYHWRVHAESTAMSGDSKPYAALAGERAINEHFARTGVNGRVKYVGYGYEPAYDLPTDLPLVSIIIPTRNGKALLKQCIDSISKKTSYKNYEILIVDNGSDEPAALAYFEELSKKPNIRVVRDDSPFNYSRLNNKAVEVAQGEVIALVNNDIEVISRDWLTVMVAHALRPCVGAVGAKLWYTNKTLQHGGVILGIGGVAGHSHKHSREGASGYFSRLLITQSLSAVTAACLVIKKSIFNEVGGLEEEKLRIAFNDIDFCLRVREAGYRNVWTPLAELFHHESASRGHEDTPEKQARFNQEVAYMKQRWGAKLLNDPAYSPNLTLDHEDFSYAWPPRLELM